MLHRLLSSGVNELVDLCRDLMHEELSFSESGILIGTEPHQDINTGMLSFLAHKPPGFPLVQNLCSTTCAPGETTRRASTQTGCTHTPGDTH